MLKDNILKLFILFSKLKPNWVKNWVEESGVQLFDFCARHSLSISNAMYRHKSVHKCTWRQDTQGQQSMIDFVVVSSDLWPYVPHTQEKRGAELSNDDHLLVSWIKWQGRKLDRPGRAKWIVRAYWRSLAEDLQTGGPPTSGGASAILRR